MQRSRGPLALLAVGGLCLGLASVPAAAEGPDKHLSTDRPPRAVAKTVPAKPKPPTKRPVRREQAPPPFGETYDSSKLPKTDHPPVVGSPTMRPGASGWPPASLSGWSGSIQEPAFRDKLFRRPPIPRPVDIGLTLKPGERFRYDVRFGGNPAGIAEAKVAAIEAGTHGSPPLLRIEGFARTSGVVSLLTTLTYKLENRIDRVTGAPLVAFATTDRDGLLKGKFRHRETTSNFSGRGYVEIVDKKDERVQKINRRYPLDTFDSLGIMAWVRSLELEPGQRAKAHALDGRTLLRVDVVGRGPSTLRSMPSIGTAIGIAEDDVYLLEGSITRVDRHGVPIPSKRVYEMRVYISDDGRKIPLVLESDMWLGTVRLELTHYDPPSELPEIPQNGSG